MKWTGIALAAALIGAASWPMLAHHSIAAAYDQSKAQRLQGVVTKFEWTNPHVYIYLDVRGNNNQVTNWEVEFGSTPDLKRVGGWRYDVLKVGDTVTAEGIRSRDGANRISGRTLTLADGKRLSEAPADRKLAPARTGKAKETPRWPDGHPRLGVVPGQRGFWADPSPGGLYESSAGNIRMNHEGLLASIGDAGKVAPFQPWAKALYEYRQRALFKDDPMAFCLPPGGPRQFQDRYGVQIVEQIERKRVIVLSGGANRNWRIIDTDGRQNPQPEEVTPTYYGYSSGRWEGDTFVVDSTAYTERFWFTNGGLPHTEGLHLTERISRPDFNTLRYEVTVNDPGTYTRPWTGGWTLQWVPDQDLPEYFCDDNNKETEHLSGKHETSTP
jgi:hypothetical protein